MPARIVEVPPDHRDDLLREFLRLYAIKSDAVHHKTEEYLADECSSNALLAHREELASVGALIDQLGWRLSVAAGPGHLAGDERLLAEVGRGALGCAVSDLSESLSAPGGGRPDVEAIGRGIGRVNGLFSLLLSLYRPAAPPA